MIFVPFCDLSYAALRETRLIYLVRGVVSGRDSALDGAGNANLHPTVESRGEQHLFAVGRKFGGLDH